MSKGKNTLKEIANLKPKKSEPKDKRLIQIKQLGDLLTWSSFSKNKLPDELSKEKLEPEMLKILQDNLTNEDKPLILMSRMLSEIVIHRFRESISDHALISIRKCYEQLETIEKLKNKGGRKPDNELREVAKTCCDRLMKKFNRVPTGAELSKSVETEMCRINNGRKRDRHGFETNRKYLPERTAREWLTHLQTLCTKESRQELVKGYIS